MGAFSCGINDTRGPHPKKGSGTIGTRALKIGSDQRGEDRLKEDEGCPIETCYDRRMYLILAFHPMYTRVLRYVQVTRATLIVRVMRVRQIDRETYRVINDDEGSAASAAKPSKKKKIFQTRLYAFAPHAVCQSSFFREITDTPGIFDAGRGSLGNSNRSNLFSYSDSRMDTRIFNVTMLQSTLRLW